MSDFPSPSGSFIPAAAQMFDPNRRMMWCRWCFFLSSVALMMTQVFLAQMARWDGLFAYLTVKLLTDRFLGRQHDASWERKVEFATTKSQRSDVTFTVQNVALINILQDKMTSLDLQNKIGAFFRTYLQFECRLGVYACFLSVSGVYYKSLSHGHEEF